MTESTEADPPVTPPSDPYMDGPADSVPPSNPYMDGPAGSASPSNPYMDEPNEQKPVPAADPDPDQG